MINKILVVFLLVTISVALSGCSDIPQKDIITCKNFIFDCSNDDCAKYCGSYATKEGKEVTSSRVINEGKACACVLIS